MFIATFALCTFLFQQHAVELTTWIDELGWLAPVFFVVAYSLATLLFLPTMVLTLAGGALFGPVWGTLFNLIGATSGAACAFLITRHALYEWFTRRRGEKLNRIIASVERKGWFFAAIVRLFPIIPFNLVNYGLGLTNIRFSLYLLTTFIFLTPTEILYTYCGYAGINALTNPNPFYKSSSLILAGIAILLLGIIGFIKPANSTIEYSLHKNENMDSIK